LSTQKSDRKSTLPSTAEPILTWEVHLLRLNPAKMLVVAPVVAVSTLVAYVLTHSVLLPVATLFLFVSALAEYLFPVRYELTMRSASVYSLFKRATIEWTKVKKCYLDEYGIKLSPLSVPGRLESYRGLYLRFGDNRDEVISTVRRLLDARTECT
jgi:hypothetical protein